MRYTIPSLLQKEIDEERLIPLFWVDWHRLLKGKPIFMTHSIADALSSDEITALWNEFVTWYWYDKPALPKAERLFTTHISCDEVWFVEDDTLIIILFA